MNEQANKLKSVSNLFKEAWEQYSKHFNVLVPIMLLSGIGLYLQVIFIELGTNGRTVDAPYAALALVATLVYIAGMIWGFSALLNKIRRLDQPMTVKQAFIDAKPLILPLFIVGLLTGIFTLIGFILLIIPGIIVAVWLSFAMYIVVAENKTGMNALKASKSYVEGYWWPIFGRILLVGLVVAIISSVIGSIAIGLFGQTIGSLINSVVSLIITPFAVLYQYNLYLDVKRAKGGAITVDHAETPSAPTPVPAETRESEPVTSV